MSPASGDLQSAKLNSFVIHNNGFHSINVPSEWGLTHFSYNGRYNGRCFHSINVPSEWGPKEELIKELEGKEVSIQLMSPASGD